MRTVASLLARVAATTLIAVGLWLGLAGSASAHDVLVSSDPADGSTVAVAPTVITFTFDQPVQNFDPVVSLIGPDGKQYATGTPAISGNVVTGTVGAGPAGAYTAAYRIVSADGHPVTGEVRFTLAGDEGVPSGSAVGSPSVGAPSPAADSPSTGESSGVAPAPATEASAAAPVASSGGLSTGLWIALVVAALVVAAAVIVLLRRPRTRSANKDY
ncbi:methionine-rich copper-binding protein CopC [Nakamurella sp. UYEF19]|uniref:copper resistance CopC family protein n=1 Tax=Nakamurella sp. UYEF19 TaxID=1756392 RepID=UPI003390CA64